MLLRRLGVFVVVVTAAVGAGAQSSTTPPAEPKPAAAAEAVPEGGVPTYFRPETAEQRADRIGTKEDPGYDPDPNKVFWRFGKPHHIERYDRRWAVYDCGDPGWVRPFGAVNICKELYQQNDKYVWVWFDDTRLDPQPETEQEKAEKPQFPPETIAYLEFLRGEFAPLEPPPSGTTVRFEESSDGLANSGSWRNSGAIADMNGDGHLDIIAPPERGRPTTPVIFLGDGTGKWTGWTAAKWPGLLDYGSVTAGDLNKDGHTDLVFGVHLKGVYALLGDSKGNFTQADEGLPRDYPTRRVVLADVDQDGFLDIVAITEGPTAMQGPNDLSYGKLRAFLNRNKARRWEPIDIAPPKHYVGGDWLTAANLNGDRRPDFIGSSIYFSGYETLWLSHGSKKWSSPSRPFDMLVPAQSYYHASTAGKFTSKTRDDAVVAFARFWPDGNFPVPNPDSKHVAGVDRISFAGAKPTRTPIMRWNSSLGVWGMGHGDFDGDGKLDLVFTRFDPRELVILLGDGKGGFRRAGIEGVSLPVNVNYDLKVSDFNKDGRPDVMLMYETKWTETLGPRDGSIRVYLNRGVR